MKIAKGPVRKLLVTITRLQDLVGRAQAFYENDRNPDGYELGGNALEEAFNLCVQATSDYYPTDAEEKP